MMQLRFFLRSLKYSLGRLCRQYILLAGLVLLCLFLPLLMGEGAAQSLTQTLDFQGLTIAITAPEGDTMPALLEEVLGRMEDISRYCSFRAMDRDTAEAALEQGQVVAVLALPEGFVQGVMTGENPDVTLIVDDARPVESTLTLWVGQSAVDLLSTVQAGIYTVIDAYDAAPVEGLTPQQVVNQINLEYINRTLRRSELFETQDLPATGTLPAALHYGLSLLFWLCLSLPPLFFSLYRQERLVALRRLRSVGGTGVLCCLGDIAACTLVFLPLLLPGLLLLCRGGFWETLALSLGAALFCGLWGSLCCLLTGSAARCGSLSFLVSLAALFLSGGILPPVLLPPSLQRLMVLSPVTWLRNTAAILSGFDGTPLVPVIAGAVMLALALLLYRRRMEMQEVEI